MCMCIFSVTWGEKVECKVDQCMPQVMQDNNIAWVHIYVSSVFMCFPDFVFTFECHVNNIAQGRAIV